MVHSKVPAEKVASYISGWKSSYWDPLKAYLANGKRGPATKMKASRNRPASSA